MSSRPDAEEASPAAEHDAACLEQCLRRLPAETRALLTDYYHGATRSRLDERRQLAERLGLTYGALKTRAHRARHALEICVRACLRLRGAED